MSFYDDSVRQGFRFQHEVSNLVEYYQLLIKVFESLEKLLPMPLNFSYTGSKEPVKLKNLTLSSFLVLDDLILSKKIANKPVTTNFGIKTYVSPVGFVSSWRVHSINGDLRIDVDLSTQVAKNKGNLWFGFMLDNTALDKVDDFNINLFKTFLSLTNPNFAVCTSRKLNRKIDPSWEYFNNVGWFTYYNQDIDLNLGGIFSKKYQTGTLLKVDEKYIGIVSEDSINLLLELQKQLVPTGLMKKKPKNNH